MTLEKVQAKRTLSLEFSKIKYKRVSLFIAGKRIIVTTFGVADGVNKDVVDSEVVAEDLFT